MYPFHNSHIVVIEKRLQGIKVWSFLGVLILCILLEANLLMENKYQERKTYAMHGDLQELRKESLDQRQAKSDNL